MYVIHKWREKKNIPFAIAMLGINHNQVQSCWAFECFSRSCVMFEIFPFFFKLEMHRANYTLDHERNLRKKSFVVRHKCTMCKWNAQTIDRFVLLLFFLLCALSGTNCTCSPRNDLMIGCMIWQIPCEICVEVEIWRCCWYFMRWKSSLCLPKTSGYDKKERWIAIINYQQR